MKPVTTGTPPERRSGASPRRRLRLVASKSTAAAPWLSSVTMWSRASTNWAFRPMARRWAATICPDSLSPKEEIRSRLRLLSSRSSRTPWQTPSSSEKRACSSRPTFSTSRPSSLRARTVFRWRACRRSRRRPTSRGDPATACSARAIRSSVTPAIADTTTAGRRDAKRRTIPPTCLISEALASDVPPNFITTMAGPTFLAKRLPTRNGPKKDEGRIAPPLQRRPAARSPLRRSGRGPGTFARRRGARLSFSARPGEPINTVNARSCQR